MKKGKSVYLSKLEAEWIINMVDYLDAPINKEEEAVVIKIREKAMSILK